MSIQFQVETRAGAARAGRMITPHGEVETPVFMPVGTLASVKGMPQDVLEELGVQILLGNTYHLYLRPGVETVRHFGGLHGFMAWPRAILTDSGGFQVFSLNELRKVTEEGVTFRSHLDGSSHFFSPESAMEAQIGLGADIIMAFDECTEYPADRARTKASMELTLRWAERSKKYFEEHKQEVPWGSSQFSVLSSQQTKIPRSARNDKEEEATQPTGHWPLTTDHCLAQSLFGIVQGGMDLELRKESAERTVEIGFPGYAIGGLSVGEPRERTREVVEATLEHLPKDKPRYLMGVGTPSDLLAAVAMGFDMFDCVLPTRNARNGMAFTSTGAVSIKQAAHARDTMPLDPACDCRMCRTHSRAYLRHLYLSGEILAARALTEHNLHFFARLMRDCRDAIASGNYRAFATVTSAAWGTAADAMNSD
jgi:queuine tRNA-ribosyltransferase